VRDDSAWVWMATGAFGAFILALVLIPLRELTSASNLAFAFVVVTIVVAELGGRAPALVTAVVSAMSLNFFLTRPYLTLLIDDQDDVIAFLALLACGLVAAAFGRRRARSAEAARRSQAEIHALRDLVAGLEAGAPLDHVLDTLRGAFGLGRVVLRDGADRVLGAAPARPSPAPVPATELEPEMLLAQSTRGIRGRAGASGCLRAAADSGSR
jgi:two-component system sensor histidine kinase KdpD